MRIRPSYAVVLLMAITMVVVIITTVDDRSGWSLPLFLVGVLVAGIVMVIVADNM